MKKIVKMMTLAVLFAALAPMTILASDDVSVVYANNVFEAGSVANVTDVVAQDIFAAGQNVSVKNSSAIGNVFAAGNNVGINDSNVQSDVFAAGQIVTASDIDVEGNVFAAGQSMVFSDVRTGGLIVAGSNIQIDGGEAKDVYLSGDTVTFNGIAYGDVKLTGEKVIIGDKAKIVGMLTVNSSNEPEISETAIVSGYEYNEVINDDDVKDDIEKISVIGKIVKKIATRMYWIPVAVIMALVLSLIFGKSLDEAKDWVVKKPAEMIVTGAVMWALVPVTAIVVMITIIGAPLGGMLMLAYMLCIFAGLSFAGASLGRLVFPKLHPVLASVIGAAILQVIRIVPVFGILFAIAADMYLLGYVGLVIYNNFSAKKDKALPQCD